MLLIEDKEVLKRMIRWVFETMCFTSSDIKTLIVANVKKKSAALRRHGALIILRKTLLNAFPSTLHLLICVIFTVSLQNRY